MPWSADFYTPPDTNLLERMTGAQVGEPGTARGYIDFFTGVGHKRVRMMPATYTDSYDFILPTTAPSDNQFLKYSGSVFIFSTFAGTVSAIMVTGNKNWTSNIGWNAVGMDRVAWSAGTVITVDKDHWHIVAGTSGTMAAETIFYLDLDKSATTFQESMVPEDGMGDNKLIVAAGWPTADTTQLANVVPRIGVLGFNSTNIGTNSISTGQIKASAITADQIAANAVTAAKITSIYLTTIQAVISDLSVLRANMGTLTSGQIVLSGGGWIRSGQTAYNTGTGFWIGYDGATTKFSFGNSNTNFVNFDGTTVSIKGTVNVTGGNVIVSGGAAADVNANTTTIGAGKILISGATKLSDWSHGSDATKIDGGDIYASSLTAAMILVSGTTYLSDWKHASDGTKIDGGDIYTGSVTANQIHAGTITGNEIASNTSITAGSGNDVAILSGSDATYRIWAGNATAASAPFSVTKAGALAATSATITGTIKTAASGTRVEIGITGGAGYVALFSGASGSGSISGSAADFYVSSGTGGKIYLQTDGGVYANGDIYVNSVVVSLNGHTHTGYAPSPTTAGQAEASKALVVDASRGIYNLTALGIGVTANDSGYEFQVKAAGSNNCDMRLDSGSAYLAINVANAGGCTLTTDGTFLFKESGSANRYVTTAYGGTANPGANAQYLVGIADVHEVQVYVRTLSINGTTVHVVCTD